MGLYRQGLLKMISYYQDQERGLGLMFSQLVLATLNRYNKIPDTSDLREEGFILAHRFKGFIPS